MAFVTVLAAAPAFADYTFSFAGLSESANLNNSTKTDQAAGAYMNSVLGSAGTATVSGAVVDGGYTADGHVTGQLNGSLGSYSVTPYTLSNYQGGGTFLVNDSGAFGGSSDDIFLNFSLGAGVSITGISFKYEIFPDISCTALTNSSCGGSGTPNDPDITVLANGNSLWTQLAPTPTSPSYVYSPDSVSSWSKSKETAPQLIGTESLTGLNILPVSGVISLDFQDWPATIGINDVTITTSTTVTGGDSPTPEPSAIALLGTVILMLLAPALRRKPADRV